MASVASLGRESTHLDKSDVSMFKWGHFTLIYGNVTKLISLVPTVVLASPLLLYQLVWVNHLCVPEGGVASIRRHENCAKLGCSGPNSTQLYALKRNFQNTALCALTVAPPPRFIFILVMCIYWPFEDENWFYVCVSVHHKLIYIKEPTWCNLALCLFVTAILLYMFRTLFASIFRST